MAAAILMATGIVAEVDFEELVEEQVVAAAVGKAEEVVVARSDTQVASRQSSSCPNTYSGAAQKCQREWKCCKEDFRLRVQLEPAPNPAPRAKLHGPTQSKPTLLERAPRDVRAAAPAAGSKAMQDALLQL